MKYLKSYHTWYFLLFCVFCTSFWVNIGSKDGGRHSYQNAKPITDTEVRQMTKTVLSGIRSPLDIENPITYYGFIHGFKEAYGSCMKRQSRMVFISDKQMSFVRDPVCKDFTTRFSIHLITSNLMHQMEIKFGQEEARETTTEFYKFSRIQTPWRGELVNKQPVTWLNFWLESIGLAFIFLQLRTKQSGSSILLGLGDAKMWLCALFPIPGILIFKVKNPLKQAIQAVRFTVSVVGLFFFWSAGGIAQAVPKIGKKEESRITQEYRLWTTTHWSDYANEITLGNSRLQASFTMGNWGVVGDFNLHTLQDSNPNWLFRGFASYDAGSFQVNLGKIATAVNFTPAPFQLTTDKYMRTPFSFTALGLQLKTTVFDTIQVTSDITFAPDPHFSDSKQFDSWNTSLRINKRFSDGQIALDTQLSDTAQIYGIDASYRKEWRNMSAAAYTRRTATGDLYGGWVFGALTPPDLKWLELHTQVDYQNKSGISSTILTNGFRLVVEWCKGCTASITSDIRTLFNEGMKQKSVLGVKLQLVYEFSP